LESRKGNLEQRTEIVSPFPKLFQEIWDKTGKCVRWLSTTKGEFSMDNILTVPIHHKMTLTAREAAEYSNIGINKIDSMLRSPNCPFVLFVGTKKLVKRREFEEYISQKLVI
jgi:hypothetical protein